jgi:predicted enzyme related to lactoylglutathione lyase
MAIARYPSFVLDCPDPAALATFYGTILGWSVKIDDDWADIKPEDGSNCISFQQVADYQAPQWPGQDRPQQMHLDVMVPDLDVGEKEVLELGATKAEEQPGTSFRVFLDPAGHPFCLCVS